MDRKHTDELTLSLLEKGRNSPFFDEIYDGIYDVPFAPHVEDRGGTVYKFTRHATERMQQRGIKKGAIEALLRFSQPQRTSGGLWSFSMNRKGHARAKNELGREYVSVEQQLKNCYLIVDKEKSVIITMAHRKTRFYR